MKKGYVFPCGPGIAQDAGLDLEKVAKALIMNFKGNRKKICTFIQRGISSITPCADAVGNPLCKKLNEIANSPELSANFIEELHMLLST